MKMLLKKIWWFINEVLDHAIEENKNKLFIAPVVIAAIIGGAVSIGSKIAANRKAKKAAEKLDREAAIEKANVDKESKESLLVAKGVAKEGDPTAAKKARDIKEAAADTAGKVTATSGSTQEVINAAQGIQKNVNTANLLAKTQESQFKLNAKKLLSERFSQAAQLKLAGNAAVDTRTQSALAAIGANAQASVDSAQSLASLGIQAAGSFQQGQTTPPAG